MPPGKQLHVLIAAELDARSLDFKDLADHLQDQRKKMQASRGLPIVVDSNVLMQCLRLDQLDWFGEIKGEARVMLPLRVVEEIDAKKQSDSKRLRGVARGLLPWIDSVFPGGNTGPVRLREGATLELLLADRPRNKPSDADEEILDVCHEVRQLAGTVKLMTGDTGMRVRATTEGLDVLVLPEKWKRDDQPVTDLPS